jgi:RNase P subunit RPR2
MRIAVECLRCGHCSAFNEKRLENFGLERNAVIASFVKRLTCEECGSHSVRAFRIADEPVG